MVDERETHTQKRTRSPEAIAKGWEINDFVECLR